jgi:SAM-dependent methyltransferase
MAGVDFDAYEAAGWEDRAAAYRDFFPALTARIAPVLLDAAGVGPGCRVVDVACGPGEVAAACAIRGARVVGLDIADSMVGLARARHPHVEFRRGDAHSLPFGDGSLDAVLGNFAIMHFGRPERAMSEFVRVLAPGGAVALSTWDAPARARFVGVFVDAVAAAGAGPPASVPDGPPFFRFAGEGEFFRLLSGAGLGDVAVRTVSFVRRFGSADELWDGMLGATVRTRDLILGQPAEMQARIRSEYDRLVSGYAAADGALEMPVSVKVASGRLVRPGGGPAGNAIVEHFR